jgi:hypothetical protein
LLTALLVCAPVQAQDAEPTPDTDQPPAPAEAQPETAAEATGAGGEEDEEAPPPTTREVVFWSLTGVAGVAILTGGVFGLTALAEERRFEDNPSNQARDRGEARALAADILFGVGAAAALAAVIVLLTGDDEDDAEAPEAPAVEATMSVNGALVEVRF